jgi:phenylpropionate dioxygenase-like ring-hydroxylating dioxygenase large terminal subunit
MPDSTEASALATETVGADLSRVGAHPDHWYPLAWSRDLKPKKMLGVRFAEQPIVLARTESGAVVALEDRCAHRQVPLHGGVVTGEHIKCGYHGWSYDGTGRCISVPYIGACKQPNGVRSYPVKELEGLIFVFPGDSALAKVRPLPDLKRLSDPAYKTRRFGRDVKCHYTFMHENLMDMNHQFMHRKLMGSIRATCVGHRSEEKFYEVQYTFSRTGGRAPFGEAAIFSSKKGTAVDDEDIMTIRTVYPHQTLNIRMGDEDPVMELFIAYVPQDAAQRTIRTFGTISVQRPKIPGLIELAWPLLIWFTEGIFREDRFIVEREQEAWDRQGYDANQEIFPAIRGLRTFLAQHGVAPSA